MFNESPGQSAILRRAIELTRKNLNVGSSSASALAEEVRRLRSDMYRLPSESSTPRTPPERRPERPVPRPEPQRRQEPQQWPETQRRISPEPRPEPQPRPQAQPQPEPLRSCCCCCRGCRGSPGTARASQTPLDLPEKVLDELERLRKENLRLVTILNRTKFQTSQSKANTLRLFRPAPFRP